MATIDLSFTVSQADQTRILNAYQSGANVAVNGTATPQQVQSYVKGLAKSQIQSTVVAYETGVAQAALPVPIPPVLA